jgi:hypothetical protein
MARTPKSPIPKSLFFLISQRQPLAPAQQMAAGLIVDPRPHHSAHGRGHCRRDHRIQKLSSTQMPQGGLYRRLRKSSLCRNGLQADRNAVSSRLRCLPKQEKIHDECRRSPVVAHQIGHQNIDDIGIEGYAIHSSKYYSTYQYRSQPSPASIRS